MVPYPRLNFRWIPGQTIDKAALARMREHFPKPTKKPYVAWFMGEINYHEAQNFREWSVDELGNYLFDTNSGIKSFGRLRIWVDWFHHMLPYLIEEHWTSTIADYFYAIYAQEIFQEYHGFFQDIFKTLMQTVMDERYWINGDLKIPDWSVEFPHYPPGWLMETGCPLEASIELCIKYLPEQDLPLWVESIAEIKGKVWQIQVKYWIEQFKKMPEEYHIPEDRAKFFLDELRKYPDYADI